MDDGVLKGRLGLEGARIPQSDRHGLLWLARGNLYVDDGTLRFRCAAFGDVMAGDYAIPFQTLSCLILQPGTSLTHDVLRLCAAHGTGLVAVGEGGARFFASAPLSTHESLRARKHATIWCDPAQRIERARTMYRWRMGEVVPTSEIAVLRGIEGARMKDTYRRLADAFGLVWRGRRFDRNAPTATDLANQAINHAVTAVEATAMVAVAVTGAIAALGFIHEDSGKAFTLDVTDLYRDTVTIPAAFAAAKKCEEDERLSIERVARKFAANELRKRDVVSSMIDQIKELLDGNNDDRDEERS